MNVIEQDPNRSSAKIIDAAFWVARKLSGTMTKKEHQAYLHWLNADDQHLVDMKEYQSLLGIVEHIASENAQTVPCYLE